MSVYYGGYLQVFYLSSKSELNYNNNLQLTDLSTITQVAAVENNVGRGGGQGGRGERGRRRGGKGELTGGVTGVTTDVVDADARISSGGYVVLVKVEVGEGEDVGEGVDVVVGWLYPWQQNRSK